jgi:hypothetical protein
MLPAHLLYDQLKITECILVSHSHVYQLCLSECKRFILSLVIHALERRADTSLLTPCGDIITHPILFPLVQIDPLKNSLHGQIVTVHASSSSTL